MRVRIPRLIFAVVSALQLFHPGEVPSDEANSGVSPGCGVGRRPDCIPVIAGSKGGRCARADQVAIVIVEPLLLPVGEAVQHQEINYFVFPVGRGRKKLPVGHEPNEIQVA